MASQSFREYLLISRPTFNRRTQSWVPFVHISWKEGSYNLDESLERFISEQDAECRGFVLAKRWIDSQSLQSRVAL
jgi:hypothetical protein